jgi:glyoxylase-like metal-dependent hydrolase (beta-lactamase superfamily II)
MSHRPARGAPLDVAALPLGEFTFGSEDPWPGQAGLVVGYAVRHPGGVFLFDTGFAPPEPELETFYDAYRVQVRPILDALSDAGIARDQVTAIANCHLHLDHCGQNPLFPNVPIYVQPAEWAAANEADYTVTSAVDFPRARNLQVEGDHEPAPGIRIFATPGHSPGHQSLLVETPDGALLLAGQAVYSRGEWAGIDGARDGSIDAPDRPAYARSVAMLRALNPKRVLFGHDRRGWPG